MGNFLNQLANFSQRLYNIVHGIPESRRILQLSASAAVLPKAPPRWLDSGAPDILFERNDSNGYEICVPLL